MSGRVSTKGKALAAAVVLVLSSAAMEGWAVSAYERAPGSGTRTYANARVVAVDMAAGTLTVRGGGIGKDETFAVEPQARAGARVLKPGDEVILALRAVGAGEETVTRIDRAAPAGSARRAAGRRDTARAAPPVADTPPPSPPTPRATPAASAPSPAPTSLPTDIVGPFRDPRVDPNFDPRQDPLRDPRVIPGLSEPAPTPAPSPSPR
jgi:hypothetical protein